MSHIAEQYAKDLGVRIGSPVISSHFYPLPEERYITFHTNDKKVPSRHYMHWDIVLDLLKGLLSPHNIKIVQTGGPDDPPYDACDRYTQGCSFKQMFYIINNSLLHLGMDSVPVHMASACDKKIVSLYSNIFPECSGPLWNKSNDTILISPDFNKYPPSFALNEQHPKRIDRILPERIAQAVLDLLDIDHMLDTYRTLNIGLHHASPIVEAIPESAPPPGFSPNGVVNLRCDYGVKEEILPLWLGHRSNLMISEAIPPVVLFNFKENISALTIFLGDPTINPQYLQTLNKLNLKFNLICKDADQLSDTRLRFFDWVVEEYKIKTKKDIDFASEICDNTYYQSRKILISNSTEYYSKAAWKAGIEKTEEPQPLIDDEHFWEELEHFHIYNYAKKKKDRNG
jgi:hypothetical protein